MPTVREIPTEALPGWTHPRWETEYPWLVQGTTARGDRPEAFDLRLFGDSSRAMSPSQEVLAHWDALRVSAGATTVVCAPQPHGSIVRMYEDGPSGLHVADACDGHVTGVPGVLLTVTAADCVPVFLVEPASRTVGALHAGWRGVADGVLERGIEAMMRLADAAAEGFEVHFGPAMCGLCYEVGPEVFEAVGWPATASNRPIDLRLVLSERARAVGVPEESISVSTHCTKCTPSHLFSHRAGDQERQVGYIGIRGVGLHG